MLILPCYRGICVSVRSSSPLGGAGAVGAPQGAGRAEPHHPSQGVGHQPGASGTSLGTGMCLRPGQDVSPGVGSSSAGLSWSRAGGWHSYSVRFGVAGAGTDGLRLGWNGAPRPTGMVGRAAHILLQSKSRAAMQLTQKVSVGFEENTDEDNSCAGKGSCHKGKVGQEGPSIHLCCSIQSTELSISDLIIWNQAAEKG